MKIVLIIAFIVLSTFAGELTLKQAQELLLKNNYDLRSSAEEISRAEAEIAEAKSAYFPSLDASAGFNYVTENAETKINIGGNVFRSKTGQNDRTEFGVDLSYPFLTGGSRYNNIKIKETAKLGKELNLEAAKNRYSFILGTMYFKWDLSSKQLEVRKKSIEQMARYTEQMKILQEGGVVVLSRVLEGQAKLKAAQLDYILARDQIDSLKLELLGLINIKDDSLTPQTGIFSVDTLQIPDEITMARPEISAYDKYIEQLKYSDKIMMSQRLPIVTGIAGYRVGNPGLNLGLGEFMDYITFGAQLKWNILNGSKTRAQRAQISKQSAIIKIEKEKSIDSWNRSFNMWRMQVRSADERIVASKASMTAAEELMISLENSLKSGVITDIDYESAVTNYLQAGLLMEQAKFTKRIAVLNALYASGMDIRF